jgi:hypothetical protein
MPSKPIWLKGSTIALSWLTPELGGVFTNQPLLAAVDTRNIASIRVFQKCHFTLLRKEVAELQGTQTEDFVYQFGEAACAGV